MPDEQELLEAARRVAGGGSVLVNDQTLIALAAPNARPGGLGTDRVVPSRVRRLQMSTDRTQEAMHRYFDLMGKGADFAECYAADVRWLVADTGQIVEGAPAVRDYVVALHASRADWRTHTYVVAPDHVYLEGDCAEGGSDPDARIRYCVAYDVEEDLIHAMRCYGIDYQPSS